MGILYAVLTLAVIGAVCAVILVLAAVYMNVPTDETAERIRECLPGANCGACGFAGCDGYAEALAKGTETRTNLCVPGGDKASRGVSEVLGVEFSDVIEQVAFVKCMGDCDLAKKKFKYDGISSCKAAKMLYSGEWACSIGCLGYGDCVAVCPEEAISIVGGIAKVESRLCHGCGLCAKTCPNGLISLMPDVSRVIVTCSNTEKGAVARQKCENACIGCKKCEKVCPEGAVKVENNLAVIDYDKCLNCHECAKNCPVGCIKIGDFSGVHRYDPEA